MKSIKILIAITCLFVIMGCSLDTKTMNNDGVTMKVIPYPTIMPDSTQPPILLKCTSSPTPSIPRCTLTILACDVNGEEECLDYYKGILMNRELEVRIGVPFSINTPARLTLEDGCSDYTYIEFMGWSIRSGRQNVQIHNPATSPVLSLTLTGDASIKAIYDE
jgi:hypothetical protein